MDGHLDQGDAEAELRAGQLAQEVVVALGPGAGDQPDMQRDLRHGERGVAPEQVLGLELAQKLGALGGQTPQQGRDVDLGQDEADLSLGAVEIERAAQDHDHPLRELDALLGQPVTQRRPGTTPALDVEGGDAPAGPVSPRPVLFVVDQVQEEVARAVVREVGDLAAHPHVAVAWEGLGQGAVDLLVEVPDRKDTGPTGGLRGVGWRQGLGVEELTGTAGHPRHPTEALRGPLTGQWPVPNRAMARAERARRREVAQLALTVSRPGGRSTGRILRDRVEEGRDSAEQGAG